MSYKMSYTHNTLQSENNCIHWKIADLVLYLNYFSFANPKQNLTRCTYLNTKR